MSYHKNTPTPSTSPPGAGGNRKNPLIVMMAALKTRQEPPDAKRAHRAHDLVVGLLLADDMRRVGAEFHCFTGISRLMERSGLSRGSVRAALGRLLTTIPGLRKRSRSVRVGGARAGRRTSACSTRWPSRPSVKVTR